MAPRLLPCPACDRHVRIIESFCPFCGATLPLSYQGVGAARVPTRRLGRAAIVAFGAAALIGCGGDDAPADTGTGDTGVADTSTGDTGTADTGTADTGMMMPDTSIAPAYGAPADVGPVDSGLDAADDGAVGNLYGAPPEP